jgi:hypothetical protein
MAAVHDEEEEEHPHRCRCFPLVFECAKKSASRKPFIHFTPCPLGRCFWWVLKSTTARGKAVPTPHSAFFSYRKKLAEVELCEGLLVIGDYAFTSCGHLITKIIIPNSPGGLTMVPSMTLFNVIFVSTMALRVLENTHLVPASSPTLEPHPSSL